MPAEQPEVGETWSNRGPDGRVTSAVVSAVDRDVAWLAARNGRTAAIPIRSLLLTWNYDPSVPAVEYHQCSEAGCEERAFFLDALSWHCVRHVDGSLAPVTDQEVQGMQRPSEGLTECPTCARTLDESDRQNRICPRCRANWLVIHNLQPSRFSIAVTNAVRDARKQGKDADTLYISTSMWGSVITDNRNASPNDVVLRGAPGGRDTTYCGIRALATSSPFSILIFRNAHRAKVVRRSDSTVFTHCGEQDGRIALVGNGGALEVSPEELATDYVAWSSLPSISTLWADATAESIREISTYTDVGQILKVQLSEGTPVIIEVLFHDFLTDWTPIPESAAPSVGSFWEGTRGIGLVREVDLKSVPPYARLLVSEGTRLVYLRELLNQWVSIVHPGPLTVEVTDEWETRDGEPIEVLSLQPEDAIAFASINSGPRKLVTAKDFASWVKVERKTFWDRLNDD